MPAPPRRSGFSSGQDAENDVSIESLRSCRMRLVATSPAGPGFPSPSDEGIDRSSVASRLSLAARPRAGTPAPRGRIYRPWILGPAVMVQQSGDERGWCVDVDTRLRPVVPRRASDLEAVVAWRRSTGRRCRIGVALVASHDFPPRRCGGVRLRSPDLGLRRGAAIEIYGWSLLVSFPGRPGVAVVDAHDDRDEIPAYYENPAELADRAEHLAARGIPSRAIALVTRPEDFAPAPPGVAPPSLLFPGAVLRPPAPLSRLL